MKLILAIALISFVAYRNSADPVMLFCACHALILAVCIFCKRIDSLGILRRPAKQPANNRHSAADEAV